MEPFRLLQLRGNQRHWTHLKQQLKDLAQRDWQPQGIGIWGAWSGLFGLASTDLFVIVSSSAPWPAAWPTTLPEQVSIVGNRSMLATARPTSTTPVARQGFTVIRLFDVQPDQADQFVELSQQAWQSFTTDSEFEAEPLGLFQVNASDTEAAQMLLVTWYDSMASWQRSRQPAAAATDNFQQRQRLTSGTIAYALQSVEIG